MGVGRKVNNFLLWAIGLLIASKPALLSAQVVYFQHYEDILCNRPILVTEIRRTPFWRVLFVEGRPIEIWQIDSSGLVSERSNNTYNDRGSLLKTEIYQHNRLVKSISYQPDSLQTLLLKKIMRDPNFRPQTELLTETEYDSLQRPGVVNLKDYAGKILGKLKYRYGERGELVLEQFYGGNEERLLGYTEFEFSLPDSIQTVRQYDEYGSLKSCVRISLRRVTSTR